MFGAPVRILRLVFVKHNLNRMPVKAPNIPTDKTTCANRADTSPDSFGCTLSSHQSALFLLPGGGWSDFACAICRRKARSLDSNWLGANRCARSAARGVDNSLANLGFFAYGENWPLLSLPGVSGIAVSFLDMCLSLRYAGERCVLR